MEATNLCVCVAVGVAHRTKYVEQEDARTRRLPVLYSNHPGHVVVLCVGP